MLTVGVDLAAEAARTAVAWIDWDETTAVVRALLVGAADADILAAIMEADKAGIDCPLGWPDEFVSFVSAHRAGGVDITADVAGRDGRRRLAWRRTDEEVRQRTGLIPLSVAADRIGHAAMRCAGLLARLAGEGPAADRSGAGVVVEVYPAASLKIWGLPYRGYKQAGPRASTGPASTGPASTGPASTGRASTGRASTATLGQLVDAVLGAAPWLDLGSHEGVCRRSDHAIDAVIAALAARAAALGLATRPAVEQAEAARTEGWIALPTSSLGALKSSR